jgi:hypothetical protein
MIDENDEYYRRKQAKAYAMLPYLFKLGLLLFVLFVLNLIFQLFQ